MTRPRLLLVDDHQMILESFSVRLSGECDIAGTARSGAELLALLPNPSLDCVLLDLLLRGKHGLEVLPEIRVLQPALKVIVVSMLQDRSVVNEAFRLGADGYVPKDAGIEELLEAIKQVIGGRRYLSSLVPKTSHLMGALANHRALAWLTPQEHRIFALLGEGKSFSQVAAELGMARSTFTFHKRQIMKRLGIHSEDFLKRYTVLLSADQPPPPRDSEHWSLS